MKKLIILVLVMIICPARATQMCTANDVVSVVLDPNINGGSSSYNATTGAWSVTSSYGLISGTSACLSKNYGTKDTITDNGAVVVGGEQNGSQCHCKMLHPAASRWVFNSSISDCASFCARNCGNNVRGTASFRVSVFGSVAN